MGQHVGIYTHNTVHFHLSLKTFPMLKDYLFDQKYSNIVKYENVLIC